MLGCRNGHRGPCQGSSRLGIDKRQGGGQGQQGHQAKVDGKKFLWGITPRRKNTNIKDCLN